jgi:hypothetical protein
MREVKRGKQPSRSFLTENPSIHRDVRVAPKEELS